MTGQDRAADEIRQSDSNLTQSEINGYFQKKKKEENCDVLTDNVFIYVECSQVSIITIQSHRLFFVKTPGGVKRHSCLCCRAGFFFFFLTKSIFVPLNGTFLVTAHIRTSITRRCS